MAGEIRVTRQARPEGGVVATVTIAHEAKLNTLNTPLMRDLVATIGGLSSEDEMRAVVLTGAGTKAFIGGADIGEMAAIGSAGAAADFIRHAHECCAAVRLCHAPVIARINGWTLGAGLELAASCDLRIAADTAMFGMPEVRVGIPSVIEAALLPGLIGWGRARRLLLLGETIGAAEAERWGLVERVAAPAALDATVEEWLAQLLAAGPKAIRIQKTLMRRWESLPVADAVAAGIPAFASAWTDDDEPRRMMRSFLDRPR